MSWAIYALALLVTFLLQGGVVNVVGPELLGHPPIALYLALALLLGLVMSRDEARLAALGVGLLQDLTSAGPVGIHTFTCGLAAMVVSGWRDGALFPWPARFVVGLTGGLLAAVVRALFERYWSGAAASLSGLLLGAVVTAVVAAAVAATLCGWRWLTRGGARGFRESRSRRAAPRWESRATGAGRLVRAALTTILRRGTGVCVAA